MTSFTTPDLYRAHLYRGIYARVARKLGLKRNGRSHVSRVATGERRSTRVEAALAKELEIVERKVARFVAKQNRERAA
jgi:hypothetical protein